MSKTNDLLPRLLCFAGLLFVATDCGDGASPPSIEYTAVPVSTNLQVPEGEICGVAQNSSQGGAPVALRPGGEGWQEGNNLLLRVASPSGSLPYGLIFLHGAGETVPPNPDKPPSRGFACTPSEAVPAEIGFVQQLLRDLGGGIAVFPQALPKFTVTIDFRAEAKRCPDCPVSLGSSICVSLPDQPRWLPPVFVPDECYVDPGLRNMDAWEPFFEEYTRRIKKIAQNFQRHRGIPLEKIYLLGFSEGAVMAQRALIALANDGIRLGGGIGFDGMDVQLIASKETFENLRSPHPEILYFLYSACGADREAASSCLENYPGINLQFYQPPKDKNGTHSTYMALVEPTRLWIQARNKENERAEVQQAWNNAAGKILLCEDVDPCPTPTPSLQ